MEQISAGFFPDICLYILYPAGDLSSSPVYGWVFVSFSVYGRPLLVIDWVEYEFMKLHQDTYIKVVKEG